MEAAVFAEVHEYWFGPLTAFDSFPADRFQLWFGGEAVDLEIAAHWCSAGSHLDGSEAD